MKGSTAVPSYEEQLARAVLDGAADAERAALTLFEREGPETLTQAVDLIAPYGPVPPETFDRIRRAYDLYSHTRHMPSD